MKISPVSPPTAESTEPDRPQVDQMTFPPSGIFYDGPSGKYLVDAGSYFRTYGRKSPVVTGVERYYKAQGLDAKQAKVEASDSIRDAEIDRHVEWSGNLAGHSKGLFHSVDGKPMLILSSPAIPEPSDGPATVIMDLIDQAFPDDTQRNVLLGWMAGAYRSVRSGIHQPQPMLCLAGEVNSGKSLLAFVVEQLLGGRSANPHTAWTGRLPWNDNLCAAELLLLDDCEGSTDIRSRINFGSNFKSSIYSGAVEMKKRHASSITVRPVWSVMVCCNDNAESLMILPPINSDTIDKVSLLKISKITPPVDTSTPEGKQTMRAMIRDELPALAGHLLRFEIPVELRDSRAGTAAWRHPDLTTAIDATKPETRLAELLATAISAGFPWTDLPRVMSASEVESRLLDQGSAVRDQARALFGWHGACGTYLARLADGDDESVGVADGDTKTKVRRFVIRP